MPFEGTFWLLWEDEPLNLETTRFFEFGGGKLFDARTNQERGTYSEVEQGVDAVFDERYGEREVIKLRMTKQFADRNGQRFDTKRSRGCLALGMSTPRSGTIAPKSQVIAQAHVEPLRLQDSHKGYMTSNLN